MGWIYLVGAILCEVCGTLSMKEAQGFTRLWPSISVFAFYGICLVALTLAIKHIELSIAYAVWAGLGTALVSMVGIFWYGEPAGMTKIFSIALIMVGVAGLKLLNSGG